LTLGTMNKPSDTGYDGKDSAPLGGPPPRQPPLTRVGPKGDRLRPDATATPRAPVIAPSVEVKRSWHTGGGPSPFFIPGIAVRPTGASSSCDRENDRHPIFTRTVE